MSFVGGQLKVDGQVQGWYQAAAQRYDLFGTGNVCAVRIVCLGGDVAVSSVGVAGCVSLLGGSRAHSILAATEPPFAYDASWFSDTFSSAVSGLKQVGGAIVGAARTFGNRVRDTAIKVGNAVHHGVIAFGRLIVSGFRVGAGYKWASGRIDPMGSSCDVGPYRAVKTAVTAGLSSRSKIKIGRVTAAIFRFKGQGAPPQLELTGPRGDRIMADNAGTFVPG